MKKMKWIVTTVAVCVLVMASAAATQATSLRAFVASYGSDANLGANCPQATPCRTFNVAIGAVTAGGELIALDTSGYGPITSVNKAITIAAIPGHTAFVVAATGTSAFTINGAAADLITLRNISFNGSGAANTTGVLHNSGRLVIDDCTFAQLATGLRAIAGEILVSRSFFTSNSSRGVHASGTAKIDLFNCELTFNGIAVTVNGFGGCPNPGGSTNPTTVVRLDGGMVSNSTNFAFEMLNVGGVACSPAGHGLNIFVRIGTSGTDFTTNFPGYFNTSTNFLFVQGQAPAAQILIGTYSMNNQSRQP